LTGLLAQIRFYLPGTPVPVTGQVFGVFLAAIILGTWGGISQIMYLGIGAVGVPWFAGYSSGLVYITGPTGGYLIGFIFAAFFIGFISDRYIRFRKLHAMIILMLFSTFILIYIPGLIYFYLLFNAVYGLWELIIMCVLPFIAADLIKAIIAALIVTSITPKKSYGREVDFR
jgi:biotin transport system substrate-specific component